MFLPGPPLLDSATPGSPRSTSVMVLDWRRSISVRSTTVTEARVSSAVSAVRVVVTTTGSSSVTSSTWARAVGTASRAMDNGSDSRAIAAREGRDIVATSQGPAHRRAGSTSTARGLTTMCARRQRHRRTPPAAAPGFAAGRSPGLRAAGRANRRPAAATPSHGADPMWIGWTAVASCRGLSRLPLRGQRRLRDNGADPVGTHRSCWTGFPFNPSLHRRAPAASHKGYGLLQFSTSRRRALGQVKMDSWQSLQQFRQAEQLDVDDQLADLG